MTASKKMNMFHTVDTQSFVGAMTRLEVSNKNRGHFPLDNEFNTGAALGFCRDSIVYGFAKDISQELSEYHVWKQMTNSDRLMPNSNRSRLINCVAEEKGVKAATVKAHLKVSGPLVQDILSWIGQELWTIVIVILLYLRKFSCCARAREEHT